MKRGITITAATLIVIALAAIVWLAYAVQDIRGRDGETAVALTVYCAAGLKKPVEEIAEQYRLEQNVQVQLQYGGTSTLLSAIRVAKRGDLFISADSAGITDARKFDVIREVIHLVRQHPVIAVRAGNPKSIHSLADLMREDVRLALANPEAAAIGRTVRSALGAQYEPLAAHATVQKPTVTEIAADVSLGGVDAAILWDATVPQFKGLEAIEAPELSGIIENASVAVLAVSQQSAAALRFARYLAAPEKGGEVFRRQGFTPIGGDKWAAMPELILYSCGVNRLAIEQLLDFMKANRARFENAGFQWRGDEPAMRSAKIEVPAWLRAANSGPNGAAK